MNNTSRVTFLYPRTGSEYIRECVDGQFCFFEREWAGARWRPAPSTPELMAEAEKQARVDRARMAS